MAVFARCSYMPVVAVEDLPYVYRLFRVTMADKCLDEVTELCLPARFFHRSVGIAFDVGGSRCKVAFKKRPEPGASKTSGDKVTVVMAGFLRHRLTEVLDYVKKNADYSVERRDDGLQRQLLITGVFFTQSFATTVETELNMSTGSAVYVDEFTTETNSISILIKNFPEHEVFYPRPSSPWTAAAEKTEDKPGATQPSINTKASNSTANSQHVTLEEPDLILSYGSATGITLVPKDGDRPTLVNGCPEGGISLLALAKLLVGTDDFAEFMALAVRGNVEKVSTTAAACRDATYFDKFPPNAVVHAFGNVLKPDYNANPEDMARALLTNAIHNIASMTVWTALAKNSQTVYMCGGVFEHQLSRDLFTYIFEGLAYFHGKRVMKCLALKYSTFLPVLGAVLDDCVSNNNKL